MEKPWVETVKRFGPVALLVPLALAVIAGILGVWQSTIGALGGEVPFAQRPEARPQKPVAGASSSAKPKVADAGSAAVDPKAPPPPALRAAWGSADGQLGHDVGEERNAEGPPALVSLPDGGFGVLDAVNGRFVRTGPDGKPRGGTKLAQRLPQDAVALPDGSLLTLDRLAERSVQLLGPDGAVRGELPLAGRGVPEPAGVTGLFVDGDDVFVEVEHDRLVRIGDTDGRPDAERPELDGRPSLDGARLHEVVLLDRRLGRLLLTTRDRASLEHLYTRELRAGEPVFGVLSLDTDAAGGIYVGLLAGAEGNERVRVLCLSREGELQGAVEVPASTGPEELFRPVTVSADGTIRILTVHEDGAQVHALRCGR